MLCTLKTTKQAITRYFAGRTGVGVNPLARFSVLRPIAMSLIVTMLTLTVAPAVQAAQSKSAKEARFSTNAVSRYSELVRELKEIHHVAPPGANAIMAITSGVARGTIGNATNALRSGMKSLGLSRGDYADVIDQLNVEHETLLKDAAALQSKWKAANVAPEVITEQTRLDTAVTAKHAELIDKLKAANASANANDPSQQALKSFLQKEVAEPRYNKLNLKNLPWQSHFAEAGKLRAPIADSATLKRYLADKENTHATALKSNAQKKGAVLASSLSGAAIADSSTKTQLKALPISTSPSAADLAPTPDAPHTDAIRDLAVTQLKKNPVAIYNWVHDNIQFFPSYGSIQGAQDTLDKKSGNAFDQASLLIAMLRSAGIQARYVLGTVDVPEAKLRNWLGDFKTIDAAQQILGQGGIPNVALVSGGRIKAIRMEHAWVEAYVSMFPSRGAKHVGGVTPGDHWIPLDASFKQHTFNAGIKLKDEVYFDTQGFLDSAKQGATVNEAEGWVQNLNQANIKTKLDQYQQSIKSRIDQQPNATVGDVLGSQAIITEKTPFFSDSLKNPIVAVGERYSVLPNSLRAQFRYGMYFDQFSYTLDSPDFRFQIPTSEIAGKKITIAWVPASDASRQAIEALLPPPNADGTPIRPEQLPQGLPGSISLKAELRIEGQVVATSGAYRAGSEPIGVGGFTPYTSIAGQPGTGSGNAGSDWDETQDGLIAGQQTALGVSIQGISKNQLDTLKTRMEATKGKLEQLQLNPSNTTPLNGLTGDTITGDILTANIWGWFADLQGHGRIASSQATVNTRSGDPLTTGTNVTTGIFDRATLGYGLFHANAQPNKIYGLITTGVTFKGVLMDIGHVRHMRWVKDTGQPLNQYFQPLRSDPNDANSPIITDGTDYAKKRWIAYNKMRGQYASALEHAIPERFFNDTTKCNAPNSTPTSTPPYDASKPACAEGISAVKAIAIAQSQGQKVFTITQSNASVAIPLLSHRSSVIDEVSASVAAGKEVTIHQAAITANGWSGAGYSVVDPETGTGGYLIEGGARGGYYSTVANGSAALFVIALLVGKLAFAGLIPVLTIAIGFYLLVLAALVITAVLLAVAEGGYDPKCAGDSACESFDAITKIVAGTVAIVLLGAGLSGNLIALGLAIFLLRQIFTRGGP